MENLAIVRGNDFFLEVPVRNIVFIRNESTGEIIKASNKVDLDRCEVLKVNIVDIGEWRKSVPFTIKGTGNSDLKIKIDGCLECGWYGIEVFYKLGGYKYRSYERKVFKIVEHNGKSNVSGEQYQGEQSYQVDTMWTLMSVIDEAELKDLIREVVAEEGAAYEPGTGLHSAQLRGSGSVADGEASHAEGSYCTTEGFASHVEGSQNAAIGDCSHAEGFSNTTGGEASHVEGEHCSTGANYSHAGGFGCETGEEADASFAHGHLVTTTKVGEFALGVANEPEPADRIGAAEKNVGEDYLIGSVGGGYKNPNGRGYIQKNLLEIWRNGGICFYYLTEKVCLQDMIARLNKLIEKLLDKEVLTGQEVENINSNIVIVTNDQTIEGMEVKPYGMLPPEEVGTKLRPRIITPSDGDGYYYGDGIGNWDDTQRSGYVDVNLGSQAHMTQYSDTQAWYPIDEWNLSGDLYNILNSIWNAYKYPTLKASLLFDGFIEVNLTKVGNDFVGSTQTSSGRVSIEVTPNKSIRSITVYRYWVEEPSAYYYNNGIGGWDEAEGEEASSYYYDDGIGNFDEDENGGVE